MAMPPNVPTSFAPQSTRSIPKKSIDLGGAFGIASYFILGVTLLLAAGVFGYNSYLQNKHTELLKSIENEEVDGVSIAVDPLKVAELIEFRDRLVSGKQVLDNHLALSGIFGLVEKLTLSKVRLTSLSLSIADDNKASLSLAGTAASFNVLAVESTTFSNHASITDAIFSFGSVDKTGAVTFSVSSKVDMALLKYSVESGNSPATVPEDTIENSTNP